MSQANLFLKAIYTLKNKRMPSEDNIPRSQEEKEEIRMFCVEQAVYSGEQGLVDITHTAKHLFLFITEGKTYSKRLPGGLTYDDLKNYPKQ